MKTQRVKPEPFDRAKGRPSALSDLSIGQSAEVGQFNCGSLVKGQRSERGVDELGIEASDGCGERFVRLSCRPKRNFAERRILPNGCTPYSTSIDRGVAHDGEQPHPRRPSLLIKVGGISPSREKRGLHGVFGGGVVAQNAEGHGYRQPNVAIIELAERVWFALRNRRKQRVIAWRERRWFGLSNNGPQCGRWR